MSDTLHVLSGHAALLDATHDDPFVRWDVDPGLLDTSWSYGEAFAFRRHSAHRRLTSLNVFGPVDDVAGRFASLGEVDGIGGISVDAHLLDLAAAHFELDGPGGDWDWMWTEQAPAHTPQEGLVVQLDDGRDGAELLRLNEIASPSAESHPGEGITELWLGVRERGQIVAAGAMHRTGGGAPHLTGIVTHPAARGRGFGTAVTAALTRHAVEADGVCTLGMYSDNDTARHVYSGLGYRTAHAWCSRRLRPST